MKYFTIQEFVESDIADRLGIDNAPTKTQKKHIEEFVNVLLDPLREGWERYCKVHKLGSPAIRISSGLRSKALNDAVGGSKTSAHYHGYAADLVPCNNEMSHFKKFCLDWLFDKDFDQIISEEEDENNIPKWIHIGYKKNGGGQRRQFLYMKDGKYYSLSELILCNYL